MKKLLTLFLAVFSFAAFAQTEPVVQKIGYADWDYIFGLMPDYKRIDGELKTHGNQLDAQLKAKIAEYQAKLKDYQDKASTMVDAIRQDREAELTRMQESIQKFQTDAQASLQKKQNELLEPVFRKVGDAIAVVAKEHGYSFIINPQLVGGGDILLYYDEKYDISALVLKKFGITPPPATTAEKPK